MISINLRRLHPEARLPVQATPGSIGLDLFAHLLTDYGKETKSLIPPSNVKAIPTGWEIEPPIPSGLYDVGDPRREQFLVQVMSRSGLALNRNLFVANAPGIIDPDYRGELMVLLYNGGYQSEYVQHGDRIAQLVVTRAEFCNAVVVDTLSPSQRGSKGLGSTGR